MEKDLGASRRRMKSGRIGRLAERWGTHREGKLKYLSIPAVFLKKAFRAPAAVLARIYIFSSDFVTLTQKLINVQTIQE